MCYEVVFGKFGKYLFDNTIPEVTFGTNGNTTWELEHTTTVSLTDAPSGLNDSTFKYLWTQSATAPTKAQFETENNTFANGDTITTPSGVSGNDWLLWIYAEDTLGNSQTVGSKSFYFDNTAPTIETNQNSNT